MIKKSYKGKSWSKASHDSFFSWHKSRQQNLALSGVFSSFPKQVLEISLERIERALAKGEKILVFGDFDADGITSTILWMTVFKALGATVSFRLPDREKDSHGLKKHHVDELAELKVDLILTCDCGTNDRDAISYAAEKGMDVIVTDHHISEESLFPEKAVAVVNPQCWEDKDLKLLAGVGVSYFLAEALVKKVSPELWTDLNSKLLELVGIGTVADCMVLQGINRKLVQEGITCLQNSSWPALQYFFAELDIENIDEETIGFQIAPRINAASRLGDARVPVFLFTGEPEKIAERWSYLNTLNEERKTTSEEMFQQALDQVEESLQYCLVRSDSWRPGILGLLAGKLCEKHGKPTIACAVKDGTLYASCRGPKGQNLMEGLSECSDLFVYFGGHSQAAGFQMIAQNLESLQSRLEEYYSQQLFLPEEINLDTSLLPDELTLKSVESLRVLRPFGMGNPKPCFLLENAELQEINMMGRDKNHARLTFLWRDQLVTTVWFFAADICSYVEEFKSYDLVVELGENVWQGNRRLEVFGVDLQAHA